jgi:phosphatidylglycerophosphate synthase
VLDAPLRDLKDRALAPMVGLLQNVSPMVLTALSLLACGGAGIAAWRQQVGASVALWLLGRLLDGLDGAVARRRKTASELGGYLDLMADVVGYACVPIGIAAAKSSAHIWMWCAILLATFYVNTMSWTLLSTSIDRRGPQGQSRGTATTTFQMPTGLIEGAETIVLFTLMLALPKYVVQLFAVMAFGVGISIVQRVVWAIKTLS